jgi:hypothetical protein
MSELSLFISQITDTPHLLSFFLLVMQLHFQNSSIRRKRLDRSVSRALRCVAHPISVACKPRIVNMLTTCPPEDSCDGYFSRATDLEHSQFCVIRSRGKRANLELRTITFCEGFIYFGCTIYPVRQSDGQSARSRVPVSTSCRPAAMPSLALNLWRVLPSCVGRKFFLAPSQVGSRLAFLRH